jgi:glycosyltransferase involved in cell wall biosynthesis
MKLALVYDRVNKFGGAERVLQALHEIWPQAPLYTSLYHPQKATWAKDFTVHTSYLNRIPWLRDKHERLAMCMPSAFESFDFSHYDVVISVTSAEAKGILTSPRTLHLCYLLTPTRYLWSHTHEYAGAGVSRLIRLPFMSRLRRWDYVAAHRPDYLIPISKTVAARIRKYYRREPLPVIYPPVDVDFFGKHQGKCVTRLRDYYLVVARPVAYKQTKLVIDAFRELPHKTLVIIGQPPAAYNHTLPSNIHSFGHVSDKALACYYHHAQALIFPQEEDFGIVAVEAQAAGKPVIAYNHGGAAETIIDGKTGCFFTSQTVSALITAIQAQTKKPWYDKTIQTHAKRFGVHRFATQLSDTVEALWRKHRRHQ